MNEPLDPPYKYTSKSGGHHYLIFPNATFSNLDLTDCNDALHGVCLEDVNSVEECIERGRDERYISGAGYYVKSKSGKKYCVPIRTAIHPFLNPALRLRRKEVHPEIEDMASWAFLNVDMYPYPPMNADVVTYQDMFLLQHVFTGMYVQVPRKKTDPLTFTKSVSSALLLHFLPVRDTFYTDQVYIPVRLEYDTLLNIPDTSLVLKRDGLNARWASELSSAEVADDAVMLHSVREVIDDSHVGDYRGVGDGVDHEAVRPVSFKETFYITMGSFVLAVDEKGETMLMNHPDWHAETVLRQATFRLVPRVEVWKCGSGGGMVPVSLAEAIEKRWQVYRSPLWSVCGGVAKQRGASTRLVVGVGVLLAILFGAVLVNKWRSTRVSMTCASDR